jgi:hypothetical protein
MVSGYRLRLRNPLPEHLCSQIGREHSGHDRLQNPVRCGRIENAGGIARQKIAGTRGLGRHPPGDIGSPEPCWRQLRNHPRTGKIQVHPGMAALAKGRGPCPSIGMAAENRIRSVVQERFGAVSISRNQGSRSAANGYVQPASQPVRATRRVDHEFCPDSRSIQFQAADLSAF